MSTMAKFGRDMSSITTYPPPDVASLGRFVVSQRLQRRVRKVGKVWRFGCSRPWRSVAVARIATNWGAVFSAVFVHGRDICREAALRETPEHRRVIVCGAPSAARELGRNCRMRAFLSRAGALVGRGNRGTETILCCAAVSTVRGRGAADGRRTASALRCGVSAGAFIVGMRSLGLRSFEVRRRGVEVT